MTLRKTGPRLSLQAALAHWSSSFPTALARHDRSAEGDIVPWARERFAVRPGELIELLPHQEAILHLFTTSGRTGGLPRNLIYSAPKKSGKSTIGALLTRWVAETSEPFSELYCFANDRDQARNRIFDAISRSIRLGPAAYRAAWRETQDELHFSNGTFIRAIPKDPKGEAGANPRMVIATELWGFELERDRRFFEELTNVPTLDSIRLIETSAGYEGESDLLWDLYELGRAGHQLTAGELADRAGAPLDAFDDVQMPDDLVPIWIHPDADLVMYWDTGERGRRMPWQRGEAGAAYYREEAHILRPSQFQRLHLNEWAQSEEAFVPIEWWDRLATEVPELDRDTPLVIGLDAGVSHDGFALVGVTRHWEEARDEEVAVRLWQLWLPPPGGEVSFDEVFQEVQILLDTYNVVEIVYDPTQLVESSQRLRRLNRVAVHKFEQGKPRALADQALYERIRDRRIVHCSPAEIREHLLNAVAKRTSDDSQRRIGKRAERVLVDLAVALAMASFRCGRLNL